MLATATPGHGIPVMFEVARCFLWHPAGVSAGPPTGVVTFLFTDIEGSTRRWEADADAMGAALAAHDEALRTAIETHDGFLFSHSGDGVAAAFASPRSAVDASVAAQRELELPVRMGLATGEAELRDGDYFGTALNRAARVMAAGHGGQILVVDSTAGLLSVVDLVNLGPRRLRDLPNPITLFQLQAPGLRTDFPPLQTLDSSTGNLRPAVTSLIGRESEVTEIEAAVRAHRLVTLTGVGGVGKTRLALEVATRLADEFPDGVWVFELAAVTDPAAVPDAVAAVLGITQQPGKNMSESVAAALEGRVRLLVFDNCEHVLDAAAELVEAIRAQSSTVRILATSREGLRLADEQQWPVPSLDVAAAVDLFVERAHSVAPRVSLAQNDAVVEICTRLDGIPLAIELAASRMASMTATDVRDRLDQRFKLLVGSRRDLERHQTLRHAVQWSYDLLSDVERDVLTRCSVFAGGFDLESACAVAGSDGLDEYAILDLLDALVHKSLLVTDRSAERTRFSMLETIRQFDEEQLAARGEAGSVRTTHARYFAEREADILELWDSPRQREAYGWFNTELANLRTAFRWAADHADLDTASTIATLAGFLGMCAENYEPTTWTEELIAPARAVDHPRLAYLYVIASLCYFAGRIEEGVRYSDACQEAVGSGRWEAPYGSIQCNLGGAYLAIGRPDRWVELCRAELARGRDTHAFVTASLVLALTTANLLAEAMAATSGLIEAAEASQNPYSLSYALLAYGYAWRDTDPERALDALRRGLRLAHDNGVRANESILAMTLGRVEVDHGDPLAALDCITLAIRNYHDSGNVAVIGVPLANLAVFLDRLGRHDSAATILGFAYGPMTAVTIPELNIAIAHLREVLSDETYDSLARKGKTMTTAAMAAYAYDQIDQARAELEQAR
jgi:predicted ATPase/class 3 adenylate cyclase